MIIFVLVANVCSWKLFSCGLYFETLIRILIFSSSSSNLYVFCDYLSSIVVYFVNFRKFMINNIELLWSLLIACMCDFDELGL